MFAPIQCDSKKKRNRDPLKKNEHEMRNTRVNPPQNYFLGSRARADSVQTFQSNQQKSLAAVGAKAEIKMERESKENRELDNIAAMPTSSSSSLAKGMAGDRRISIRYCFDHIYGAPAEDRWVEESVVWSIMQRLGIPAGSSAEVKQVCRDVLKAIGNETEYDEHGGERRRGVKVLITEDSQEAAVVFEALRGNLSTTCITVLVNELRAGMRPPKDNVSWSAVERFILNSPIIQRTRRHTKKSGKEDEGSVWAQSRHAQCDQFRHQFHLGTLPSDSAVVLASEFARVQLWALVLWDENHKQCMLGHTSKYETLVSRNQYDQTPTAPEFGGVFPDKKARTTVKFPDEARGCFGAAVRKRPDGTLEGVKAAPFCYTGRKVVGIKNFENAKALELARVKVLPKKPYDYKTRWPEDWEARLHKKITSGAGALCCITEMIDHIIKESKKIYEGTEWENTFFIYHDALKQYWEKEAIQYIDSLGFNSRLMRITGSTNARVGKHYHEQVVGDSPEFARALDAFGFSHLLRSMMYHCSLTSLYERDDQRKFLMGKPDQVWSTMVRCWEVAPTSEQIVEDIMDFDRVLKVVQDAKGCVVHGEALRNGRRHRRADDKQQEKLGDLKNKPRQSQRKGTLHAQPTHPDCVGALQLIRSRGAQAVTAMEELIGEMEDVVEEAEEEAVERGDQQEGAEEEAREDAADVA